MNKHFLPAVALSTLLMASCSSSEETSGPNVVDVAGAVAAPVEIKVSDLGSKLTYVPLETTDSSLIPQTWMLRPTDNRLLVVNYSPWGLGSQNCLAFDFNGKFLGAIGHTGQDPEAYYSPFPLVSSDGNRLYFPGYSGKGQFEQVYSVDGKYIGRVFPAMPPLGNPSSSILVDTTIYTVDAPLHDGIQYLTAYTGGLNSDSITAVWRGTRMPDNLDLSTYFDQVAIYNVNGVMPNSPFVYKEYVESGGEKRHLFSASSSTPRIWRTDKQVHYHIPLTDTIYSVIPTAITPVYTFDCGPGALTPQEMNTKGILSDNLIVTDICETPSYIIFGASKGWMRSDTHTPFVGYFDKATGKTYATDANKGFVDDLTGFMPFYPVLANERGDMIGIITMDDIAKWTEEHPDAEIPAALRDLADDANPICVILSK